MSDLVSDLGRMYGRAALWLAAESSQQVAPHVQGQILALGSSQYCTQHFAVVLGELV